MKDEVRMLCAAATAAAIIIQNSASVSATAAQIPINAIKKTCSRPEQFCPHGWEIEDQLTTDLQGNGTKDLVLQLITNKPEGGSDMQPTNYRALLVAFAKNGKLQLVDLAPKLLLCTTCGGQLGASLTLNKCKSGFTVIQNGGGGNDSFEYDISFKYDANTRQFVVTRAANTLTGDRVNQDNVVETVIDYARGLKTITKTSGGNEKKSTRRFRPKTVFMRQLDAENLDTIFKI